MYYNKIILFPKYENKSIINIKYNGLELFSDGTYNNIVKKTFTSIPEGANSDNARRFYWTIPAITPVSDNSQVWTYGFSNFSIISITSMIASELTENCIGISTTKNFSIHINGIPFDKTKYNDYLTKHPLILYYIIK